MNSKRGLSVDAIKKKLEYYCAYQDRCHQEVEKKLRQFELIPEARELILIHLIQNDFLNESRFAQSFARGKFRIKKWGRKRIVQELKFREISDYNIRLALKEINEEEYIKILYVTAESKNRMIKDKNPYTRKQKLYQYLYNRGFESNLIQKALTIILGVI